MHPNILALWILLALSVAVPTVLVLRTRWRVELVVIVSPVIVAGLQTVVQAFLFGFGPMLLLAWVWSLFPALLASAVITPLVRFVRRRATERF